MQQAILQCAIPITHCRVYHQAGRLVDHNQIIICMDDIQRYVLRDDHTLAFNLRVQHQSLVCIDTIGWLDNPTVHRQIPAANPLLQTPPGILREY